MRENKSSRPGRNGRATSLGTPRAVTSRRAARRRGPRRSSPLEGPASGTLHSVDSRQTSTRLAKSGQTGGGFLGQRSPCGSPSPDAGPVIKGAGEVRKLRVAVNGRGRRGGARAIYYHRTAKGVSTCYSPTTRPRRTTCRTTGKGRSACWSRRSTVSRNGATALLERSTVHTLGPRGEPCRRSLARRLLGEAGRARRARHYRGPRRSACVRARRHQRRPCTHGAAGHRCTSARLREGPSHRPPAKAGRLTTRVRSRAERER